MYSLIQLKKQMNHYFLLRCSVHFIYRSDGIELDKDSFKMFCMGGEI